MTDQYELRRNATSVDVIPIEKLLVDVYDSAAPRQKSQLLAQLIGKVYEEAPASDKSRIVAYLMRPIGILSLVAIAGGIFAAIRIRGGWPDVQVRTDDVQHIQSVDVIALANYAQQINTHVWDGLAQVLSTSPVLASAMSTAILIKLLTQRTTRLPVDDGYLPLIF